MDTGDGVFVKVDVAKATKGSLFFIGEIVKIKDSYFKVMKVFGRVMTLQLQPKGSYSDEDLIDYGNNK